MDTSGNGTIGDTNPTLPRMEGTTGEIAEELAKEIAKNETVPMDWESMRLTFDGDWNQSALDDAMAEFGLVAKMSNGKTTRWSKPSTTEGCPLLVDTKVDEGRRLVMLRGYVLADDGKTKLTLHGDDGVPHHAKSGAISDFEGICDMLRSLLAKQGQADAESQSQPPSDTAIGVPSPGSATPTQVNQTAWQQPISGTPQMPQGQPWTRQTGSAISQVPMQQYSYQTQPQVPGQPAMSQQPLPTQPAYGYGGQPSSAQPASQQPPQFGYGSSQLPQQRTRQGVAPGWAVQSVPNLYWRFIALACVELILLTAESMYGMFAVIAVPLLSWPAIPALVYSISYKNAFQAGNAQLAMVKMLSAKRWLIGAGIWCAIRVLFKLTICSLD